MQLLCASRPGQPERNRETEKREEREIRGQEDSGRAKAYQDEVWSKGGRRRRRRVATMVYDWEGKRDICYRMYIEEKKPLEDIIEYMRAFHQFSPR